MHLKELKKPNAKNKLNVVTAPLTLVHVPRR